MQKFDETVDVLVVGSGCGGLTAALTANITNASKVLVIEKNKLIGHWKSSAGIH